MVDILSKEERSPGSVVHINMFIEGIFGHILIMRAISEYLPTPCHRDG